MTNNPPTPSLIKQPSTWMPFALSLTALALIVGYVALVGPTTNPGSDERAPARIFQLILIVQLLLMAYFAYRWLPRRPKPALLILVLQGVAWLIPIVTILLLEAK